MPQMVPPWHNKVVERRLRSKETGMRTITAFDLGAFAAQATTQQTTAHGLGKYAVNVKTAADYERVRSGGGRFPGVMPDAPAPAGVPVQQAGAPVRQPVSSELARKEINPFVIRGRVNADQIAARDRSVDGLARPSLDKEYAASGFSGFRLKPVGEYGQASGGATFPLEYQIVATGPDGQEQLINTIKSRNAQTEPNLNPSNISKMVQQGAQRLGMKAGPKPPAPRPPIAADKFLADLAARRAAEPAANKTPAPAPAPVAQAPARPAPAPARPAQAPVAPVAAPVAPPAPAPATPPPAPAQLDQIGPTAPITMDNALGGPNGGQPSPPEPEPEAGPNGPNAGNYVPPAAPEPAPVSGLQPPEMLPKLNEQTILAQRMNFENSRRQEEYDQALKQQQDVGNNPADYPTQAPVAPEAGPNGPNAGNYVPPAAPEPEPVSALQPPEMLPKINDQSILAQRINFENSRRQEGYDQTLKQRQDVGNNPADYSTQAPAAAPASTTDSILPPPQSMQGQYNPQDAAMVAKDEAAHQAMLRNPTESAVQTGVLMSNQSTARGAPSLSSAGDRLIPQILNSTDDKINAPLSLGQRFAGPASYASPAAQYHAENLNSNIARTRGPAAKAQAYSMPNMQTADAARQAQQSINDLGFADPNYVPPTATPTPSAQPTYGQKGLTRQELATQRSVGNVGKFAPSAARQARPVQAPAPAAAPPKAPAKPVAAPAPAAAPKAPSVPVTPPAPPVPTPPPPKPTPPPVAPPPPVAAPTPPPPVAQRYAAPAPAYQPPAARPVLGGGLFGRRRR